MMPAVSRSFQVVELKKKALELLRTGMEPNDVCKAIGERPATVYQWRFRDATFYRNWMTIRYGRATFYRHGRGREK